MKIIFSFYLFVLGNLVFCQDLEKETNSRCEDAQFIYQFPNGKSVAIAGGIGEMDADSTFRAYEFFVFDCDRNKSLAFYSSVHSCIVSVSDDIVFINRRISLYNGLGNKWKSYSLSQRTIEPKMNSIQLSDEKVILSIPSIELVDTKTALATDFKNMNYDEISEFLGQLQILALNQNEKAVKLLFSERLEKATNAASTEHLFLIRETYNWVIKGVKDEMFWFWLEVLSFFKKVLKLDKTLYSHWIYLWNEQTIYTLDFLAGFAQ